MTDATRNSYEAALQRAEAELAAHEGRRQALRKTVESLKALLAFDTPQPAPAARPAPAKKAGKPKAKKPGRPKKAARQPKLRKPRGSAGAGHPPIKAGHYRGMGPTAAYRKFIAEFGDTYTVPQIRDALVVGGVESKSNTSLLTGLHSVRRRDSAKAMAAKESE